MMMEVLYYFPALGGIDDYLALPLERKALYQEFVLAKREEEAVLAGAKVERKVLS
ncbi:MAG: hypothetical protein R3Y63_09025 [Eubacteriales bacterium]